METRVAEAERPIRPEPICSRHSGEQWRWMELPRAIQAVTGGADPFPVSDSDTSIGGYALSRGDGTGTLKRMEVSSSAPAIRSRCRASPATNHSEVCGPVFLSGTAVFSRSQWPSEQAGSPQSKLDVFGMNKSRLLNDGKPPRRPPGAGTAVAVQTAGAQE